MQAVEYGWKKTARIHGVDAQKAGRRLMAIHKRKGHLSAEMVLRDAEKVNSPLHDHFEWDDSEAAEQHRLRAPARRPTVGCGTGLWWAEARARRART